MDACIDALVGLLDELWVVCDGAEEVAGVDVVKAIVLICPLALKVVDLEFDAAGR